MSTVLDGYGISADLPGGWEGRIMRRAAVPVGPRAAAPLAGDGADGSPDERMHPVVHLANFALPPDRGDYGSGAVDVMGGNHALIVLFEFGPESVGTALFRTQGMPRTLTADRFSPEVLQRRLPGQLGYQRFFTENGRAFSLFVVLGGRRQAHALCTQCSGVLADTRIEAA
jgi:hypothetical protein